MTQSDTRSLPRQRSLDALHHILEHKTFVEDVPDIHAHPFAYTLCMAVLRHLGVIDHILSQHITTPVKKKDIVLQHLLRLAAGEMLCLDTPDYATVSSWVDMCTTIGKPAWKNFVNAILRGVQRQKDAYLTQLSNPHDALWNHALPAAYRQRWEKNYGRDSTRHMIAALRVPPPLDLHVKSDPAAWAEQLHANVLFDHVVRCNAAKGSIREMAGYDDGAWWVQDAAATLPVRFLGTITGKKVLDLCAAPGGKTMQMCQAGAYVTALDRSGGRLALLRQNLHRTGLSATVVESTLDDFSPAGGTVYDAILLDAPCSATGTLRRHPELPWIKSVDEIEKLSGVQGALLRRAATFLAPTGTLVYCTCSLEPEEGEQVIAAAIAAMPRLRIIPILPDEVFGHTEWITPEGFLRTHPHDLADHGGMDGFFAARLRFAAD